MAHIFLKDMSFCQSIANFEKIILQHPIFIPLLARMTTAKISDKNRSNFTNIQIKSISKLL